jgi:hypothetical protein
VFLAVGMVLGTPLTAFVMAGLATLYVFLWYVLPFLSHRV